MYLNKLFSEKNSYQAQAHEVTRDHIQLPEALESALHQLTQESSFENIQICCQLIAEQPASEALWLFMVRILSVKEFVDAVKDNSLDENICERITECWQELKHKPHDWSLAQDISFSWTVCFLRYYITDIQYRISVDDTSFLIDEMSDWLSEHITDIDWNKAPDSGPWQGLSAFLMLIKGKREDEINALIKNDVQLDWNTTIPSQGETVLWQYIQRICYDHESMSDHRAFLLRCYENDINHPIMIENAQKIELIWKNIKALITKGDKTIDWNVPLLEGAEKNKSILWLLCHYQRWDEVNTLIEKYGATLNLNIAPIELKAQDDRYDRYDRYDEDEQEQENKKVAEYRKTVLWLLCYYQRWDAVKALIKQQGAKINWNIFAMPPEEKEDEEESFYTRYRKERQDSIHPSYKQKTALHFLFKHTQWDLIQLIIDQELDPQLDANILQAYTDTLTAILHKLCTSDEEIAFTLLKALLTKEIKFNWDMEVPNKEVELRETYGTVLNGIIYYSRWDVINFIISTTGMPITRDFLGTLLGSPAFLFSKELIKQQLYQMTESDLSVSISWYAHTEKNYQKNLIQRFMLEALTYHPTITEITLDYEPLSKEITDAIKNNKAAFASIRAASASLAADIQDNKMVALGSLPDNFTQWSEHLKTLKSLTGKVWYTETLATEYLINLIDFLQICVAQTIETSQQADDLVDHLKLIIGHPLIAQFSSEQKAHIYESVYHFIVKLNNENGLKQTLHFKLVEMIYLAYGKAKQEVILLAKNHSEELYQCWYQKQIEKYCEKEQHFNDLVGGLTPETAGFGLLSSEKELAMKDALRLAQTTISCIEQGDIEKAIGIATPLNVVEYWLKGYENNPEMTKLILQQLTENAAKIEHLEKQNALSKEQLKTLQQQLPNTPTYEGPGIFFKK